MASDQPKMDFGTFLMSLSTNALLAMGDLPGAEDDPRVNIELAKQTIDILELLEEKTRGNRTPDEDTLMRHMLHDLRLRYLSKRAEKK